MCVTHAPHKEEFFAETAGLQILVYVMTAKHTNQESNDNHKRMCLT